MKTMMRPGRAGSLCRPASQYPAQALKTSPRVLASPESCFSICAAGFGLHSCNEVLMQIVLCFARAVRRLVRSMHYRREGVMPLQERDWDELEQGLQEG